MSPVSESGGGAPAQPLADVRPATIRRPRARCSAQVIAAPDGSQEDAGADPFGQRASREPAVVPVAPPSEYQGEDHGEQGGKLSPDDLGVMEEEDDLRRYDDHRHGRQRVKQPRQPDEQPLRGPGHLVGSVEIGLRVPNEASHARRYGGVLRQQRRGPGPGAQRSGVEPVELAECLVAEQGKDLGQLRLMHRTRLR